MSSQPTSYSAYKPTGLPWLPQIPEHWGINRAKNLYYKANRPVAENAEVITCFRDGQVTLRKNRRTNGFTESLKEIGYQGIAKGDLVIHVMDAFAGAVGVSDSDGKGTPVYSVCVAKGEQTNSFYYALVVREMAKRGFIQSLYRGIRERSSDFRYEVFAAQYLPVPPPDEQTQIVRYLDSMTAKINKLIRAKKKQIALLQEQKQAIINQAVTKGLNPNAEMKDSGIDWLGQIPKHWKCCRCKYLFREINIRSENGEEEHLSMSQKFGLIPDSQLDGHHLMSESYTGGKICEENDLVLNRLKAHLGVFALAPQHGVVSPDYTILHINSQKILPRFAEAILTSSSCRSELRIRVRGIVEGFWRLYTDDFYDITLPLPDTDEQLLILHFVDEVVAELDKCKNAYTNDICILNEYKDSLISSIVTGQVDVRDIPVDDFDPADLVSETEDDPEEEDTINESEESK